MAEYQGFTYTLPPIYGTFDLEGIDPILPPIWASIELELVKQSRPRNRSNFVSLLWAGGLPDEWDWECEEQLPPDLRLEEAPDLPIPTQH